MINHLTRPSGVNGQNDYIAVEERRNRRKGRILFDDTAVDHGRLEASGRRCPVCLSLCHKRLQPRLSNVHHRGTHGAVGVRLLESVEVHQDQFTNTETRKLAGQDGTHAAAPYQTDPKTAEDPLSLLAPELDRALMSLADDIS